MASARLGSGCRAGGVLLALALAAGACAPGRDGGSGSRRAPSTSTTSRPSPGATTTIAPLPPPAPVSWAPCQDGLQCGTVRVPLDYAKPGGRTIDIALARHPATDPAQRIGSLVVNPGGPGGSGVDDLPSELRILTPRLLQRFDIVSFDPRGVDRSAPVHCSAPASPPAAGTTTTAAAAPAANALFPDPAPATAAAREAVIANDRAFAAQCVAGSDGELPFVGTVDAARDLDRIRAALGDARLTFIGHSYGTLLGLTYADLFPSRVRAMVLDGVIDPALSTLGMVEDQAAGFERMLRSFFSWCASSAACAWRPGPDPEAALLALVQRSRESPLPAGAGNRVGPGELYTALLSALYNSSQWARLGSALTAAGAGDGSTLFAMSDTYSTENGPNSGDANTAISCLDHPVPRLPEFIPWMAADAAARAPVFGPVLVWGLAQCTVWPAPPTRTPHPIAADGAPPILVVGTTGDPATPYQWAVSVAGELAHGVLVTWQGQNHVAYYYSACVRSIDDAYLVDGSLPAAGTQCAG